MPMHRLESIDDIEPWIQKSFETPVFLFKHSLICPVSSAAFEAYERFVTARPSSAGYALVEIQRARDVSNAIAERTGVRHESPQALLVRGGEVVWHASHWTIREAALAAALEAHG